MDRKWKRVCPVCFHDEIHVTEETTFDVNTGEFFCHSVKMHDGDARVECQNCDWQGQLNQLDLVKINKEQP